MKLFLHISILLIKVTIIAINVNGQTSGTFDVTNWVDPFIGTGGHGHTYPGATVPNGMIQLSPDTRTLGWDACSGYHYSDSTIMGFSHTHLSGTGIGDYGDVMLMPFTGDIPIIRGDEKHPEGFKSAFSKENEYARPGYYAVYLDDYKVNVELSASQRVGMHKYTFPKSDDAGIILDLDYTVRNHANTDLLITVINRQEISGVKITRGWAKNQHVYFYAKFSKPFKHELYNNNAILPEGTNMAGGKNIKAKLKFATENNEVVLVKVGLSAVDIEGAKKNLEAEIRDWDFDKAVLNAKSLWEAELNKIHIRGKNESDKRIFYTALYHANLAPTLYSDVDGRYRGMDKEIHSAETPNYTVFSLWDTYRALHPFFTIAKPTYNQELIRALLRKHEEGGVMPMWELASNYTGTMIGSHSVSVIADAYLKGDRDFDTDLALEAMIKAVTYDTTVAKDYVRDGGHANLKSTAKLWIDKYGYVPSDIEPVAVSQALELAYNYWCIAKVAEDMGKQEIAKEYFEKAGTYKVYFDKETGFMRGKKKDGSWNEPFDPYNSDHWKTDYVEGNAWQWKWYVPQDVNGLIELFGGNETFSHKLDELFQASSELSGDEVPGDITGLIGQYVHGNEPSHHIAYLYNYAGKPWKTQEIVAQIVQDFYSDKPDGLAGNEDCGQMSAWYLLNSMGFYPVTPGESSYSIGTPLFDEVKVSLENGNTFTVKRVNGGGKNIYVKRMKLDGKTLDKPFIEHADIMAGKTLTFEMSNKPKN